MTPGHDHTLTAPAAPVFDMARRLQQVREAMAAAGVSALFVSHLVNVRWLSGFTGSNGWLMVTPAACTLVTDGRYADQATAQIHACGAEVEVCVGHTRAAMIGHARAARGTATAVGFEPAHLSVADHGALSPDIGGTWQATPGLVEQFRRRKDTGELACMAHAALIADRALAVVVPRLAEELTEAQFRDELEWQMRRLGGDGPSFPTIIAAGANAALPHHEPDATRIIEGMTVVIDFGAMFRGYHSDTTRTYVVGDPTPLQREVYEVVLRAQIAGVAAVRAGAKGRELDDLCRSAITADGWGDWFTHGTGHGVGLQIHESPWLTQSFDDTLDEFDVVTVEPGVYRRDFGGVRIEDMVVVTTHGCQPLTTTPKDSPCLPSPPTT